MSEILSPTPRLSAPPDAEAPAYRSVCGLAVVALLAGIASPLALFSPLVWFIPLAGVIAAAVALRRIAEDPVALIGRKAALAGLALSLAAGLAAPTAWSLVRWNDRQEARQFAMRWFDYMRNKQPEKAHQLTVDAARRQPLDDSVWPAYLEGSEAFRALEGHVQRPLSRTLMALGDKAQVRYYDTERQSSDDGRLTVVQTFAVTWDAPEGPTTFFVAVNMERSTPTGSSKSYWKVNGAEGGVRPKARGGSGENPGE